MSRLVVAGYASPDGLYVRQGDGFRKLQPTLTPLGAAVRELCDAILRGEVEPCPVCNRYACDCDEWHELMHTDPLDPDPHGDLRALQAMELPF